MRPMIYKYWWPGMCKKPKWRFISSSGPFTNVSRGFFLKKNRFQWDMSPSRVRPGRWDQLQDAREKIRRLRKTAHVVFFESSSIYIRLSDRTPYAPPRVTCVKPSSSTMASHLQYFELDRTPCYSIEESEWAFAELRGSRRDWAEASVETTRNRSLK